MSESEKMSDFTRAVFEAAKAATAAAAANYAKVRGTETTKRIVTARHFTVRQASSHPTSVRQQRP